VVVAVLKDRSTLVKVTNVCALIANVKVFLGRNIPVTLMKTVFVVMLYARV